MFALVKHIVSNVYKNRNNPPSSLSPIHLNFVVIKLKWQGIIKLSEGKVLLISLFFKEFIKIIEEKTKNIKLKIG